MLMISLQFAFAVDPDKGYDSSEICEGKSTPSGSELTCCWREFKPGTYLADTYCQTCYKTKEGVTIDCDQKELQFMTTPPKTDESVAPNDGKAIDETEQTTPALKDLDQNTYPNEEVIEESQKFSRGSIDTAPLENNDFVKE